MNMDTLRILGMVIGWMVLFAGIVGSYWKLKMKDQELELRFAEVRGDLKENDEEVQKVWKKMLTKDGHNQECTIMNLRVEKAIRESGDEVQKKVEETMIDFQAKFSGMMEQVVKQIEKSNGKSANV